MGQRPLLTPGLSGAELLRWYWLKDELVGLARQLGLSTTGGKAELTSRLAAALDGEPVVSPTQRRTSSPSPQLSGPLGPDPVIPPEQRCSQELRAFFTRHIGRTFRFDAAMRDFIATGAGRTLADALEHWHATRSSPPPPIGPQFEFNRFLRDWHTANPGGGRAEAIAAWRTHRSLPINARGEAPE
ncbi:MAG: hypothetical protein JW722_07395 [Demequinaceae bacterium]|nr:hypothetical protein [Demequinaceae bacterium]